MSFLPSFLILLQGLSGCFTAPSFQSFVAVLEGWTFARRHTVSAALLAGGAGQSKHHSAFYRLFSSARWSLDTLGLAVFDLLCPLLDKKGRILLVADDTLARKRGKKVYGVGMHHDPLLSSRKHVVVNWGHSWVVLAVLVRLSCCPRRFFALPIMFRLYRSKQTVEKAGGAYRKKPELLLEMLQVLCTGRARRRFYLVADTAYGGQDVIKGLPSNCELASRLHMKARLYALPESRKGRGRKRKRGRKLPTPEAMLKGPCKSLTLHIYGRRDRVRMTHCVATCFAVPGKLLRVVAVLPLTGNRGPQAFFSTAVDDLPVDILTHYAMRWSIEQAFQECKGHLGFEEPQGFTRKAVERTAPVTMLLYSLVVRWFSTDGHKLCQPIIGRWYTSKRQPSFADMLGTLRAQSIQAAFSAHLDKPTASQKLINLLVRTVKLAS